MPLKDLHAAKDGTVTRGIAFKKLPPVFDELYKKYSQHKNDSVSVTSEQYWLYKDAKGDYWFDGNRVDFNGSDAEYIKIFDAVYSLIPHGGEVSYGDIKKQVGADKRAVQRALTGEEANFFRYVKSVKRTPQYGIPLFQAARDGKKLIFNNKR